MQASLAVVGFVLGALTWWTTGNFAWLLGAIVLVANWPYTLLVIMPTNHVLERDCARRGWPESRALSPTGASCMAFEPRSVRLATALFLWASM